MRLTLRRGKPNTGFLADRRSSTMLEMAIVLPVFLTFLLMLFEIAFDQFIQGALDSALQSAAYQVQVGNAENPGNTTQFASNAQQFIDNDLCPAALAGILTCSKLYIRVQQFSSSSCVSANGTSAGDFYDATTATLPVSNRVLLLGNFAGEAAGAGTPVSNTGACQNSQTGYCIAGQNEFIVMSAIYLVPSFVQGLFPGRTYRYNGSFVHAGLSTVGFYTEGFGSNGGNATC